MKKIDGYFKEYEYERGLTTTEFKEILNLFPDNKQLIPITIEGTISSYAEGYILYDSAEKINYDMTVLKSALSSILDNTEFEKQDCIYTIEGLNIFMGRKLPSLF